MFPELPKAPEAAAATRAVFAFPGLWEDVQRDIESRLGEEKHKAFFYRFPINATNIKRLKGIPMVFFTPGFGEIGREILEPLAASGLKWVCSTGASTTHISYDELKRLGLQLARIGTYHPESIAEHALTLLLGCTHFIPSFAQAHSLSELRRPTRFARTLHGRCVGIVGYGSIGRAFHALLQPWACEVLRYRRVSADIALDEYVGVKDFVTSLPTPPSVEFDEMLRRCDAIVFTGIVTPETTGLLDAAAIHRAKRRPVIVNVARAGFIDYEALVAGTRSGQLSGAGLDVYPDETHFVAREFDACTILPQLLACERILVTPHVAWATEEAVRGIADGAMSLIRQFEAAIH